MMAEDAVCIAWNHEHRRHQEVSNRRAQARSTPIQRGMDSRGVAATCRLLWAPPATRGRDGETRVKAPGGMEPRRQEEQDSRRALMLEQARRRECYRPRLDELLEKALVHRRLATPTSQLRGLGKGQSIKGETGGCGDTRESSLGMESRPSPTAERVTPAERDGAECDLTADMLSQLGPLKDLTGLELCVEGLTSASLLRACTSLKSLSLNVNRLTSPPDLVGGSKLVRLGLRYVTEEAIYWACLRSCNEFTFGEGLAERTNFAMKIEAGVGVIFPASGDIVALCAVPL